MTAPTRQLGGNLVRALSPTFNDHWSQPRLFLNSLTPQEQQILVNSIRFETSNVKSPVVRQNILNQLNMISNDLAIRVSSALGLPPPAPNPMFYHNNVTTGFNIFGVPLPSVATLTVGILASTANPASIQQAVALQQRLAQDGLLASVVAESFIPGVNATYSISDASNFDGLIVADGAQPLFNPFQASTLFPLGRPNQLVLDSFRWGKAVGGMGTGGQAALTQVGIPMGGPGVLMLNGADMNAMATQFEDALRQFRFLDRFPLDQGAPQAGAGGAATPPAPAPSGQPQQAQAVEAQAQVTTSAGKRSVAMSGAGALMSLTGLFALAV